ncbi:MAG: transglycosylase SLT domain-containing protein [Spirochaetales bacterium]|nr:transglycosylase SLT domain-containing protein [Spirochaetales bacterium]
MKYKQRLIFLLTVLIVSLFLSCKTDNDKKKQQSDLMWNLSIDTENSFIKDAVKEINEVKGETLVVSRYNSPKTKEAVIDFFNKYTKNRKISEVILEYSIKYEVPPTLAFALSYSESNFDPSATNQNSNSIDRGLFQLNSNTFTDLSHDEFFDIKVNAANGIKFIKWCLDTGENEVSALAMYNAGSGRVSGRGTPKMTLDYISKVLDFRNRLIDEFNSEMSSYARINPQSVKLVKDITKH